MKVSGRKPRILLINHYAGSPEHGMEFRPFYFARRWSETGFDVEIIASSFSHLRKRNPNFLLPFMKENVRGVSFTWIKCNRYQGNGFLRILNMLLFLVGLFLYGTTKRVISKYDFVIASSTYPLDSIVGWVIAKLHGAKTIFEIHDLWPLSPMILGNISSNHPFIRVMSLGEKFGYTKSDVVVSMLPAVDEYIEEKKYSVGKYVFVPNGVDIREWSDSFAAPVELVEKVSNLRSRYPFVVGYVGGQAKSNALDCLIDSAARFSEIGVGLVLVGDGPEKKGLLRKVGKQSNIIFFERVEKQAIPSVLRLFDALYIGFKSSPLYRYGIGANKIPEYMMSGKPIVIATDSKRNLVTLCEGGVVIKPESTVELISAIMMLIEFDKGDILRMGERASDFVRKNLDVNILADGFASQVFHEKESVQWFDGSGI